MKKFIVFLLIIFMIFININIVSATEHNVVVYVSDSGNDAANGLTIGNAVQTIGRAVELMRTLKTKDETGIIYMCGGTYRISDAVYLTEEDSNLTITNFENKQVEIYGSALLNMESFTTVTDRNVLCRIPREAWGSVKQTDITDFLGELIEYPDENMPFDGETGYYELYSNDMRQTLARWPNNKNDIVTDVQDYRILTVTNAERAKRWINAEKPILQGFLGVGLYHRCNVSAEYIYPESGQIKLSRLPFYAAQKNKEYFIYNLLEELDAKGEWFLENTDGKTMLYYYPTDEESFEFALNTEGGIKISGASNIKLENIDFSYFAASAVVIENSDSITVKNCNITHMSRNGAVVKDSKNCSIEGCEIADLGGSGILLNGGDKVKLERGNNIVSNCKIHSAGYTYCATQPNGVYVQGCGNSVQNCDFFDLLNSAVVIDGSMHTVRENEIYNVITNQSDAGAIYIGSGLLNFGNIIEKNYIHDVRDNNSACVAIYLDDCSHGSTVAGNIIENVGMGMLCGGGRNNAFQNNVMIDESIFYDVRGTTSGWANHVWKVGGNYDKELSSLEENPEYDEEKIIAVYPKFKDITEDIKKRRETPSYDSGIPKNVIITDNVTINDDEKAISFSIPYMLNGGIIKRYGNADESNNFGISRERAGFADEAKKDYTITDNSPILKALPKFKRTAFSEIGAGNGEYKKIIQSDILPDSAEVIGNIASVSPLYGEKDVSTSRKIEITLQSPQESYIPTVYAGNTKLDSNLYTVISDGLNITIEFEGDMLSECTYQVEIGDSFTYFTTGKYSLKKVITYDFDNTVPVIDTVTAQADSTAEIVTDEVSGSKALKIYFPKGAGEYAVRAGLGETEYDKVVVRYKLKSDACDSASGCRMFSERMPQFISADGKSAARISYSNGYTKLCTSDGLLGIEPMLNDIYKDTYLVYEVVLNYDEKTVSTEKNVFDTSLGKISGGFEDIEAGTLHSLRFKGHAAYSVGIWVDDIIIECYSLTEKK